MIAGYIPIKVSAASAYFRFANPKQNRHAMSPVAPSSDLDDPKQAYSLSTIAAASLAIAMAAIAMYAWLSHSEWLWISSLAFRMKFNTSLALFAGGAGLVSVFRDKAIYTIMAGLFLLAVGGLTLFEHMSGMSLGIDELLIADYRSPNSLAPGRMAPNAALAFACVGIVLLLLAGKRRRSFSEIVAMELFSFVVLAIGATALSGYLTHAEFAYGWGSAVQMSLGTSVGTLALGIGLMTLTWQYLSVRIASIPLWIPILLCFLVVVFDLSTPRGLAAGIAYVPIIICGLWFAQRHMVFVFAAVTTGLTVLGYFGAPVGDYSWWIPVVNRILTIGVLWVVAALIYLRRGTEAALQKNLIDLERSNQELDDFAYIASHDLKEPLRGLFNHASFLLEDYQDKIDADGVRRLNRLGQLCQRMERLINDLLYFSRLGRAGLAEQETDINAVILDIEQMMETTLIQRHARIVVPRMLPRIKCDKTGITEALRNLMTNAVKYNDKADRLVEVGFLDTVGTDTGPENNVFYVKDNGIGIDPEFHEQIFKLFKRLNPSDGQDPGTGVGLTFVKKIVERHNGRIWLESQPGIGTIFYFNLNGGRTQPIRTINEPHAPIGRVPIHSPG